MSLIHWLKHDLNHSFIISFFQLPLLPNPPILPLKQLMVSCPAHLRNNFFQASGSPTAWASSGNMLEMHIFKPSPRSTRSEILWVGTSNLFYQLFPVIPIYTTIWEPLLEEFYSNSPLQIGLKLCGGHRYFCLNMCVLENRRSKDFMTNKWKTPRF